MRKRRSPPARSVGASAAPGDVSVLGTVKDIVVGSCIELMERDASKLKGVPGSWKSNSANNDRYRGVGSRPLERLHSPVEVLW